MKRGDAAARTPDLSPEKLALLVRRAQRKRLAAEPHPAGGIPRRSDRGPAPLTFAQQRLWLLDLLEPGSTAYNLPAPLRLTGGLDVAAFARAVEEIVRRHGALRTTFRAVDGEPVQVISPPAAFPLPLADLAGLPEPARSRESARLLAAEVKQPFDLARGPLLRAVLLRLADADHLLLLDVHHIVADGSSLGVFFRELSALYGAYRAGEGSPLPEMRLELADFAVWQRGQLQGEALAEQLAYWRQRLAGSPPALELPTDRPRPAVQTHRGGLVRHDLPGDLAERLRELSRREGATLFMILLAGFDLLLSRLADQKDVVVGSPSAGRGRVEIEGVIGLFLNTLVLRADLSGDPGFRELLGRIREAVLGAYRYQDLPFEKLIDELQPERQLSRTPIFQVLFNFFPLSEAALALPGLAAELLPVPEPDAKFDFTLYVEDAPERLRLELVYNADLFDRPRMAEMLQQLAHLLTQVAADPAARIGALSLVTPAAAAVLPDPALPLSGEWRGAVHQALSLHAARTPERVALRDAQGEVWTYAELEARSNRLAHLLIAHGVAKGDAVAIWAHRNAALVQALMGTLKAGAAAMVLDPAYPATRLLDYLEIARPTAWIGVPGTPAPTMEIGETVVALCRCRIDLPAISLLAGIQATDPGVPVGADDAACITFTSGSTGVPKGVVGRHGPLTHFYPWMGARFGLGEDDCFGMLSALSHDPLQRDVFTPLWLGATLAVPDPAGIGAPGYLAGWARRQRVSVLNLTPAMMELLIASAMEGEQPETPLPALRRAFVVGEVLKKADVERLQRLAPALTCVNLYGATETQRAVSCFVVPRLDEPAAGDLGKEVLPLGCGVEGCQLLVLNRAGQLAGVGEAGEIHVRSRHLARGYLGDDALTAERFLSNPFTADAGDRIYKTGDLGRYLPGGGVEFAGRADHQVKLRGFRIELGEIEAALARHPAVAECVVVVREDRPGDRRLTAYFVAAGPAPAARDLRSFLGARLPEHMVPSAFVALPELPLTRTGKVDRQALPAPVAERSEDAAAARRPVAELLAGIWAGLLGVDGVAPGDNFFALGGQSLLAARMASRVRNAFGVELPARAVFEEPTLAGLASLIERAQRDRAGLAPPPPLVPAPRDGALPLSFSQQRLWFLDRLEPGSFAYNLAGGLRLAGSLDIAALAAAASEIVRRHESLRTTFAEAGDEPMQVVAAPAPLPLPLVDLRGLPQDGREAAARRLASAEARRPFDLGRGPLLRMTLLRLGDREHALLTVLHHIVADGWSLGIFSRELGELYRTAAVRGPSPLPELPLQYADFAVWQRRWLAGEALRQRLDWWTRQLAGAPAVVALPLDRPRPAFQSYRGGRVALPLGRDLEERLEEAARRLAVTPFMILLGGFAALLSRYGGQGEVVVGAPIANRGHAELEDLIGFFVNTLALRIDLSGDPAFGELARRVRETALGAYAHQEVPFERLVEELRPERGLSHSPVFQAVLAVQNFPTPDLDLAGLTFSPLELGAGSTPFDLSLALLPQPGDGGSLARLSYAADLFDAGTAERLLGHFRRLLEGVATGSETRLSELPLLGDEEREQVLRLWNATATAYPREAAIHGLFAEQVRRRPGAVAVAGGGEALTYAGLARRAERLAGRLLAAGARPEEAVGLCAERSADLIAALLGILQAGCAYVPLDPASPRQRLAAMLADTGARLVVVAEGLEAALPETAAVRLPLRRTLEEGGETTPWRPAVVPDQLAYVLFTSGSTGRPKGVAVTHRNVVRLVRETGYARFGPEEVFLLLAPVSFDASTLEIWGPLLNGGRLALFPPGPLDLRRLGEALEDHGVTTLWLTAGLFHQMVESHLERLRGLRQVLAGGDVLSPEHVRRALAELPGATLINGYGPTEGTTFTCCHVLGGEAELGSGPVPIGRPIANTRVYVLDAALRPVPVGVAGQLYAAGDGVARGYTGRPELTAERFVPDPVSGEPGARLYATGDLARWRPDGAIEFLGRLDAQVKIRGFRIEPGEIEAVLAGHPAVETAAVVARRETPGEPRLVAYVVAAAGGTPEPAALRGWLEERLPAYMVPGAFVPLAGLPLGPTGKLDRGALPAPEAERRPAGPVELSPVAELLAGIWSELLGAAGVAPDDDFFALGGHSLLATRMISRVRKVLGAELPIRALFEEPTLAGFAALAERALQGEAGAGAPPLVRVSRGEPLPASFSQRRLWFLDRLEPGSFAYNLAGALRLCGPLRAGALAAALGEIVRRHESLRTTFDQRDGEPRQVIAEPASLPLPVVDLGGLPPRGREAETARIAAAEARRPYDLARGPLVRTALVRLGEREHALLVGMHHIVSDGWSVGVFVRELGALYRAAASGEPSPLPELPFQYADFADWQQRWLSGEALRERLGWWTRQLAGAPPAMDLPLDRPRPAERSYRGGRISLTLGRELEERLESAARQLAATPFMLLLGGFAALLARYAGQVDVVVGTPIANRGRAELEDLIGFFVNTLALRVDLSGDPAFGELARRVRETALGAYAHQEVPFERLVEELRPERDLSRSPVFQVMLALQSFPASDLDLADLTLSPLELDAGRAHFDLALFLHPLPAEGTLVQLNYASDLFDAGTAERLLGHFRRLLEGAAADPGTPVSRLPLLTDVERRQLAAWEEAADRGGNAEGLLHGLFEKQAQRTPQAIALVAGEEALSYAALEERSARLARHLRARGVGPEVAVGVCLERTADLVVALLGVLRAGGFYVPLDPRHPLERLRFLLQDSGAEMALTHGRLAAGLRSVAVRWLSLDDLETSAAPLSEAAPPAPVAGQNLAYLIYTSGSTGRPKAVAIPHQSAVELAVWARQVFSAAELRGVLAATAVTFDMSIFEIFVPLAWGGTVVLAANAMELAAGVEVTLVNTVPSVLAELLREGVLPASVRTVNLGGEALPRWLADRVYALPGIERLCNLYGPSEDTTYSTWAVVERAAERPPAIGRTVHGTRAYVLDWALERLPVGVAGELYLAGAGLSRGYFGRPALTAERFLPDPFAGSGARMYRTGDRTRLKRDGELEYLGRLDAQVKIRGFRVEPGEIEAVLAGHPEVEAAAVVARREGPGEPRLVAYVVPAAGGAPEPAALRGWLEERLPAYMIPGAFVALAELPLGPTGKLDRGALPAPEAERRPAGSLEMSPEPSPVAELLAGIWSELLGAAGVAPGDDFFALGGHSLLATRMISRVRAVLGIELPIRALFEAPTLAGFAALAERTVRGEAGAGAPPLVRVPRGEPLPASFSQRRLWFLDRLEPASFAYNLAGALRLCGPLRAGALAAALREIVRRHESLRTTFGQQDGEPRQVIAEPASLPLPVVDLGGLPPRGREAEAARIATAEARRPYDLARGPLVRTALVRLGEREHALLIGMHHIVSDGWSVGVFVRELGALYRAAASGEPSPLPELPFQYADFADWQRRWLSGEALRERLDWWTRQLAGAPQAVDLPLDRPRPAVRSYRGGRVSLPLGRELEERLEASARRLAVTPFMLLLGGFAALLARYSGQTEVVVGAPIANRGRAELEDLIGFFVNTLALRVDLSGDPAFSELARRVRETALGAYAHQEVPFERLVEELRPERDLSHSPVFQVMLALQSFPASVLELADLTLSPLELDAGKAPFDLSLFLQPLPERGPLAQGHYARDLFDAGTVERLLGHLATLLEGAAADPGTPVSRLPLLTGAERRQLATWEEAADRGGSAGGLLHGLFEEQARRTPQAVALVAGEEALTYAELEQRSGRLARHLRARGVGPEVAVGVCLERTADLVVALLGVLRAGGFYVPLDPRHPLERLRFLLRDSGAEIALTHGRLAAELRSVEARWLSLDDLETSGEPLSEAPPAPVAGQNLAYLIYTSGSTGRPKAVAIPHQNVVELAAWGHQAFSADELRGVLASTAVTFDMSIFEIFIPLAWGGTVVLAADALELAAGAAALAASVGVTLVDTVPSVAAELLRNGGLPPSVRTVNLGGEILPRWLADRIYAQPGIERLCNLYGPSEDTTFSTCSIVERTAERPPAVGRTVHGTRAYVLDWALERLPVGVAGELYLAGAGLSRGYLGRPELTAERFLPDPFTGAGARMYRTGDRIRLRRDGELEYLGRLDHQVKVRGYRIELGEVEAALAGLPGVQAAVAIAREDVRGDRRLVAYVVAAGPEPVAGELRRELQQILPEPFIPSTFVFLDALPLTPHGKVDRRALPAPDSSRRKGVAESAAPRTPVEREVAKVWADVLGVERIGVEDSFWELGGHSLLATRVLVRLADAFGIELPLRLLFSAPTLGRFAAALAEAILEEPGTEAEETMAELAGMTEAEIRALLEQEAAPELEETV